MWIAYFMPLPPAILFAQATPVTLPCFRVAVCILLMSNVYAIEYVVTYVVQIAAETLPAPPLIPTFKRSSSLVLSSYRVPHPTKSSLNVSRVVYCCILLRAAA